MDNSHTKQNNAHPISAPQPGVKQGKVIIFSAPSGSGKTTIVQHLLKNYDQFGFSVSACTRAKRAFEVDGKDYHFLTVDEFERKKDAGEFVEWEKVYEGKYYGTLKSEVQGLRNTGKHVLFDVDVKGGINLKQYYQQDALSIFVEVPSEEELEKRLRSRKTETEESLKQRLTKVKEEMKFKSEFDQVVTNHVLDQTLKKVEKIIKDFIG
ncbi:MAG TPA: guanylate kinase [Microscillaceae bacterium]|nr:guanylate kinase [Microscillaceae bacterium]